MEVKILDIVIIDDNEMTRTVLRTILTSDRLKVVGEAGNGKSGLEMIKKLKPRVVMLDIDLPDTNGLEILKMILTEAPKTIVLMVTGKNDAATIKESLAAGAQGFVIKPFNATTVAESLKTALLRAAQQPK